MPGPIDKGNERINRSIGQRVRKTERDIAKRYAQTLNEIRLQMAVIFQSYEQDGKLTFEEMAKFDRLTKLFQQFDFLLVKNYREIYPLIYDAVGWSYAEAYDLTAWGIEQESKVAQMAASPDLIKAAVEAPIDKLTLNQRLELQRTTILATIRQEMTLGLVKGESYREMMDRIKPALENDTVKAMRVVRTEGHRVQEGAKLDAVNHAEAQGVIMTKTWNSSHDERVRRRPRDKTDHKMLDGITIPIKENFHGVKGKGPGPGHMGHASEDINCRCFLAYSIARVEKVPYNNIETATFDKWRQEKAA